MHGLGAHGSKRPGARDFPTDGRRLGFRPLHWPAAARDQRSRLWTLLIAAPNDTGGNRAHTARRYWCVGGEAKDKGGGFLIIPRHYGVVYHLSADAKATDSVTHGDARRSRREWQGGPDSAFQLQVGVSFPNVRSGFQHYQL
jgi:hypothetical protein